MRTRKNLKQSEKEPGFREMAETFKTYLSRKEYLAAYVVAFSFLEDRITAMHVVRCQTKELKSSRRLTFTEMVNRLQIAGDLAPDLAHEFRRESTRRNQLLHGAMWNLRAISARSADTVQQLARTADRARSRQKRLLARQVIKA